MSSQTGTEEQADTGEAQPDGARRVDPRVVRSRGAVLQAVRELLAEQGWAAVTPVAVAARSGIGRTTLYRHWPEPAAMIRDAIAERIRVARTAQTGELRKDLLSELGALRGLLHDPLTERALRAVIERAGVDPTYVKLKEFLYQVGARSLRTIVEDAKARGDLPPSVDTDLAVDQLAGPLMFRRLVAERTFGDDYVEAVVEGFLRTRA